MIIHVDFGDKKKKDDLCMVSVSQKIPSLFDKKLSKLRVVSDKPTLLDRIINGPS